MFDDNDRRMTVTIRGDVWQNDMSRKDGPKEVSQSVGYPDLGEMAKAYERRHGKCSSFTIEIVK